MRRIEDDVERFAAAGRRIGVEARTAGDGRRRWAGVAGVAGPLGFTVTFLGLERARGAEFSRVRLPVSALEAGPYGWVQQLNFVVFGLLTLVFALGLHHGMRRSRHGAAGPALMALSGVALLLAAAIPFRVDAAGSVYAPTGHVVAGTVFFSASALALVVLCLRMARDRRWQRLVPWTLAAGIACVTAFLVTRFLVVADDAPLHAWAGLVQRATILLALFPARIALSLRLLRRSGED